MTTATAFRTTSLRATAIHAAFLAGVGVLLATLANWRAVNEGIVYLLTFGGHFWLAFTAAVVAGTLPMARAVAYEKAGWTVCLKAVLACLALARGAWLAYPASVAELQTTGDMPLQAWALIVLAIVAVVGAAFTLAALIEEKV